MSYGVGIFLVVVGAILSFAVQDNLGLQGVDLTMIGYILMGAGALGLILGLVLSMRKRRATEVVRSSTDPVNGQGVTVRENTIQ